MRFSPFKGSGISIRIRLCSRCLLMFDFNSKAWQAKACRYALVVAAAIGAAQEFKQTQAEADRKNAGCISCHGNTDAATMHPNGTVRIGCADCHGGDFTV